MRGITPVLKRIVYPTLSSAGYFSAADRHGLAVVTYHGILPPGYRTIDAGFDGSLITADTFRQQLRLLKRTYAIISPEEFRIWCREGGELPRRAVLLTCDDGLLSNLSDMVPILLEEGLRCLFFITGASAQDRRTMLWYEDLLLLFLRAPAGRFSISVTGVEISGVLGEVDQRRRLWWNAVKRLSPVGAQCRQKFLEEARSHFGLEDSLSFFMSTYHQALRHFSLLTAGEVQQLAASGMTIGAHTMTHPVLSLLPREMVRSEMVDSRIELESLLQSKIWAFAYPFGDPESVSPAVVELAKQVGFEAAFLNAGGGLGTSLPAYAIPRVHVNAGMGLAEFEAHVSGFYEAMKRMVHRSAKSSSSPAAPVPISASRVEPSKPATQAS
jgi:peptidoglycan/xylan/chitin deacetylase (PgdA/CDA1 family)